MDHQELERIHGDHVRDMDPQECEVLYGRAGYLASLLFAAKHTGQGPNKEIVQVWPNDMACYKL